MADKSLKQHLREISKKGGEATKKKYGKEHYKKMVTKALDNKRLNNANVLPKRSALGSN